MLYSLFSKIFLCFSLLTNEGVYNSNTYSIHVWVYLQFAETHIQQTSTLVVRKLTYSNNKSSYVINRYTRSISTSPASCTAEIMVLVLYLKRSFSPCFRMSGSRTTNVYTLVEQCLFHWKLLTVSYKSFKYKTPSVLLLIVDNP